MPLALFFHLIGVPGDRGGFAMRMLLPIILVSLFLQPTKDEGEAIAVNFSNGPGNRLDWIGLADRGASANSVLLRLYTDGTQNQGTPGIGEGSVTFAQGLSAGSYEARFYENDQHMILAKTNFSVRQPGTVENLLLPANGGVLESFTSEYGQGWVASDLTDGITDDPGWSSAVNPGPQEFIYHFRNNKSATLNQAIIHSGSGEGSYFSKDVEVWISADGSNFSLSASGTLANQVNSITLELGDSLAKKVKLVITSGYQSDYWELGEFIVRGAVITSGANNPPVAQDKSVTTAINTAKTTTLNAQDADGDALSFTIVDDPAHGTLSVNGSKATYTPDADYSGADSFTFRANDGKVDSNVATVSISVSPAENQAPVANDQNVQVNANTPLTIGLSANDADGDPLSYTIVDDPAHGTLSGSGATLTYTPNANYTGPDSFTFQANDGQLDSNLATVTIEIKSEEPASDGFPFPGCATGSDAGSLFLPLLISLLGLLYPRKRRQQSI